MRYTVRHQHAGHEVASRPLNAELAVQTACALAAAGRRVVVRDASGREVDLDELAEQVLRARGGQGMRGR